ncbi:ABC transporter permease [Anoxybacillus sp. EFIL]|uniref:ABC transporter permease n=1 Tax=Anoxybacillus sp. EFIL TaxID=2508869 RepID=UPI000543674C|nr:ABC transporter permease [Anoxybacillus sp. EFIL]KHF27400.1 ABC-2 family transporter protein [Anoxybacillus sp. BCO1]NNU97777.1 ABC transporter permease [Anoxybacillus sp. EFIL]
MNNKFWIVFAHTYMTKLKSKSFFISTVITTLIIFGIGQLDRIIEAFSDNGQKTIGVIDQTNGWYEALQAQMQSNKEIKLVRHDENEEQAKKYVQTEKWYAYIVLHVQNGQPKVAYYAKNIADSDVTHEIEQALQQVKIAMMAKQIGLTYDQINALYAPIAIEKVALEKHAKTEEQLDQARTIVYVLLFAMYMFVLMYGSMIMMEVATEKSSRIMEILISSTSPIQQLFGKILGIALLSLTQFVVIFTVGYTSLQNSAMLSQLLGMEKLPLSLLVYGMIFFLLGYLLYAMLFAVLGSIVSRVEEVQQMAGPVTMLVVAAFIMAMVGLNVPESPFITVMSFVPFFTPMIMFLRIGMLNVPIWEIVLSLALLVGTIAFLFVFGSKIYRGGVLMYNQASSWKDLKRAWQLTKR